MSPIRVAAYCALLLAVANVVFVIALALLPAGIYDVPDVLFQAGSHPVWYQILFADWALTGLLGLAVVTPATSMLAARGNGWTDWAVRIAYVGYAVTLVQGAHEFVNVPQLGELYHGCGTCTASLADQQTLAKWLYGVLPLDKWNWFTVGGVGLWMLALSITGFGSAAIGRGVLYVGVAAGALYVVVAVVGSLDVPIDWVAPLAVLVGAFWYAWVGILLRRDT